VPHLMGLAPPSVFARPGALNGPGGRFFVQAVNEAGTGRGPPRVVIADDHLPTRVGLRMALEAGGFTVVGEVSTGPEALEAVVATRPDACLIDVLVPGGGIAAAQAIRAHAPRTAVVMLTVSVDPDELVASVEAGVSGYLPKAMEARRLPAAMHRALSGEPAVPRRLVGWLFDEIRTRGHRRGALSLLTEGFTGLTPRERQVLDLMSKELPTQEVAARLGISPVTVRRHVSALRRKLGAPDRQTLLMLVHRGRGLGDAG
jgi:two-component system nitrate/nitrite response regulator NarL